MRLVVPLLVLGGAAVCLWSMIAPADLGLGAAWFPREVTRGGEEVDRLFTQISVLMGVVLVLTALLLAWAVLRGAARRAGEGSWRAGSVPLELLWTALPALALAGLLVRQLEVREALAARPEGPALVVGVDAHQFEWRFRYAGADGEVWTADDLVSLHELALPADVPVELRMRSRDAIHSFFAPALRTKRDVVPGRETLLAFTIDGADLGPGFGDRGEAVLGLECAELCGWGHAAMVGRIRVLDADGFQGWLEERAADRVAED